MNYEARGDKTAVRKIYVGKQIRFCMGKSFTETNPQEIECFIKMYRVYIFFRAI